MATRTMQVLKDMKYGTRMLRAGDTVDMKGPDVRLYTALGAVGPLKAQRVATTPPPVEAPPPVARKAAAPKRKAEARKKRATAKK
jgi:hypothetical protein